MYSSHLKKAKIWKMNLFKHVCIYVPFCKMYVNKYEHACSQLYSDNLFQANLVRPEYPKIRNYTCQCELDYVVSI